jgi:hypothetical protein
VRLWKGANEKEMNIKLVPRPKGGYFAIASRELQPGMRRIHSTYASASGTHVSTLTQACDAFCLPDMLCSLAGDTVLSLPAGICVSADTVSSDVKR